jgi:membrane protease YdiL (CAAX protease family)
MSPNTCMDTASDSDQVPWKARDAWLCILALVVCELLLHLWVSIGARGSPAFLHWLDTLPGSAFSVIAQGGLWLFFAFWFSRAPAVRDFFTPAGLRQRVNMFGWCAACLAFAIALIDGFGHSKGLTASSRPHRVEYLTLAAASWVFVKTVVIVPFYEEAVTRGFLYRAFRGSYGVLPSITIVLCFSAYFHWSSMSRSLFTATCFGSLWALLCIVREQTGSLWNCFLGHAVYNFIAVGFHLWLPAAIVMLALLPLAARQGVAIRQGAGQGAEPGAAPSGGPAALSGGSDDSPEGRHRSPPR